MADPRDYKLDITGLSAKETSAPEQAVSGGRPYLRVHFACCHQYVRIYRSPDGQRYAGNCPRCGKPVRFIVGPGGTSAREFIVY
ncbi:MAG: hypothetical protein ACK4PI_14275 [Tepidisphaerales bacterium]